MEVMFVMGTRPEVIKLAPVLLEARRRGLETVCVVTAQHREWPCVPEDSRNPAEKRRKYLTKMALYGIIKINEKEMTSVGGGE